LSALVYNPLFHEEESSSGNQVLDIQEYIVEQLNQHLHKQLIMHRVTEQMQNFQQISANQPPQGFE
jgi:hypothetical protein